MATAPPQIFSRTRRITRFARAQMRLRAGADPARFLIDDIAQDIVERLAFLRHEPQASGTFGLIGQALEQHLLASGTITALDLLDEERPLADGGYDFLASVAVLDTVNDLPGALIHMRNALVPGGLAIASFPAAGSLANLRRAMIAAEPQRPAARMHPLIDAQAGAQLLQRAGWRDPVVDARVVEVSYPSLDRLVEDLRDQGLGSALARPAPPLSRRAVDRARAAFLETADERGRVSETFAILTLSGRRSLAGT